MLCWSRWIFLFCTNEPYRKPNIWWSLYLHTLNLCSFTTNMAMISKNNWQENSWMYQVHKAHQAHKWPKYVFLICRDITESKPFVWIRLQNKLQFNIFLRLFFLPSYQVNFFRTRKKTSLKLKWLHRLTYEAIFWLLVHPLDFRNFYKIGSNFNIGKV